MCLLYKFNLGTLFFHVMIFLKIRLLSVSLCYLVLCTSPFFTLFKGYSLLNLLLIRFFSPHYLILFFLFLLILFAFCRCTGTCSYDDLGKGYVVMIVLYFHNLNIWWWGLRLLVLLMVLLEYRGHKVDEIHRSLALIVMLIRVERVLGLNLGAFLVEK
jgi:hypothetical protein